jgi:hypothetical protein
MMSASERITTTWPLDSTIVNVHNPNELEFWCERFGVSRENLIRAVDAAGHRFKDVDFYLVGHRGA